MCACAAYIVYIMACIVMYMCILLPSQVMVVNATQVQCVFWDSNLDGTYRVVLVCVCVCVCVCEQVCMRVSLVVMQEPLKAVKEHATFSIP